MIQGRSHRAILPTDSSSEEQDPFGSAYELTNNGVIRRTLADGSWKKTVLYDRMPRRSEDLQAVGQLQLALFDAARETVSGSDASPDDDQPEIDSVESDALQEGSQVLCTECEQEIRPVAELDGDSTCWMLKAALMLAAWLGQHPGRDVRRTLAHFAGRLQSEASASGDRAQWVS